MSKYPMMLTKKVGERIVPVVYPPGHEKAGAHVVFEHKAAEREYDGSGVPHDGKPEQHSQPDFDYTYSPPAWTRTS